MRKHQRHTLIAELLQEKSIRTQQALVDQLAEAGVSATQTTLSRDLTALGVVKTASGYRLPGRAEVLVPPAATQLFQDLVRNVQVGGTMLVLHTPPAHADAVALQLDELSDPDLLGTIAGDDTVFVATRNPDSAARLARVLFGHETQDRA
ncbi:MAG: arginine repressor [Planctomycetia bacterium]|nr:arginine repressor [Planctomycetia bacterium]